MTEIVFRPLAVRDIKNIGDYIHADNPFAARRFVAALRDRCVRIADAPYGGRLRPEIMPNLRSVPCHRYVVFYTVADGVILIERILHWARDIESIFDSP